MGTIAVHEFISLDGVFEDPRWTFEYGFDPRMGETIAAITGSASAILLGRRTFEAFAPAWSGRTAEDDPGAPFFNETPKYVVGSSETSVSWANSTLLGTYDPAKILELKSEIDGSVYVSGSGTLVRAMLADGLVDELHLFVYPVVLGSGARFFEGSSVRLELRTCEAYENGVVHLAYGTAAGS